MNEQSRIYVKRLPLIADTLDTIGNDIAANNLRFGATRILLEDAVIENDYRAVLKFLSECENLLKIVEA